jgi:hypothetical protein
MFRHQLRRAVGDGGKEKGVVSDAWVSHVNESSCVCMSLISNLC